jgi:hypothetical protein
MTIEDEVYEALLARIKELAPNSSAPSVLTLAEAYAWIRNPSQPHGSRSQGGS